MIMMKGRKRSIPLQCERYRYPEISIFFSNASKNQTAVSEIGCSDQDGQQMDVNI